MNSIVEHEKALGILKRKGALLLTQLAKEMSVTNEGARFNLIRLAREGYVVSSEVIAGRGRPKQVWTLTEAGHALFPDAHAETAVKLIEKIKALFGEEGIHAVIASTAQDARLRYKAALDSLPDLESRVKALTEMRDKEGYMARYEKEGDGYLLIEDHCPICAAAAACQHFCSNEIQIFRDVLQADVRRTEHVLDGGRRCAYKIAGGCR
ncbi:helix-turn-helix transcriptional regulator [Taibaiella koreensis]|uniref:helix-turn-helix transcriptional regulator n=1 Tax=Taibaiella koreensis TaxID=1268548 RepID=UPI000E59BA90|nr:helix-turn-helix transcriptional regulator [Taibaiella koreensis]